jgi:hypothetical protein
VLFDVVQEYYWPAMQPIYEVLSRDSAYELSVKIGPNQQRLAGVFLLSRKKAIEARFAAMGCRLTDADDGFDAVICGDTLKNPSRYGRALLCNVDHGPCFKTLRYRNLLKQPRTRYVVCAEGPYRVAKLRQYGLDQTETVVDVGLPKLDPFAWGRYRREDIIARHGLDPSRKVVLYAPTYKPTSIYLVGENIAALADTYNVIVKLHPYSWSGKYASHGHHRLFERVAVAHPAVRLVPAQEHDIMPYLFAADTMISEGSSVINEFLALGRCGIIFDLADEGLRHSDGAPLLEERPCDWLKESFVHISNVAQLPAAVREALDPSPARRAALVRDKAWIYSATDGCASQRLKLAIEQLLASGR